MKNALFLVLVTLLVTSCNSSSESGKAKKEKETHLLEGHLKALEKAKDAEKKVKEAAAKQRKAIEEATQNQKQSDKG